MCVVRFFSISWLAFSWLIASCSYLSSGNIDPNFHPGLTVDSPTITVLDVSAGTITGGTSVMITGTGFLSGAIVTFGGLSGSSVSVVSSTSLIVTTPAHAAGIVDVVVTNSDGQSVTLANGFTYQVAPTVTSLDVTTGGTTGGTSVMITGTGFVSGAIVTFGGSSATSISVVSSTSISLTTSAHAVGVVDVVVTNADGQSGSLTNAFTYFLAAPTVTSLSVTAGSTGGGTNVTVTGTGFYSGATVTFGGVSGTFVSVVSSTTISVTTPAHAGGSVNVVVTNTDTQSGSLTNGFTYRAAPTITSLNISAGATGGGTSVTITGTGFLAGATVAFGGTSGTSVSVVSGTSITVTTPVHVAGAVNVVVTNTDSQSGTLTNGFTYQAAPIITSLNTTTGTTGGGTSVTITGTGFLAGATVIFGGTSGTSVSVVSGTSITVTTPAHVAGAVNVVVTNTDSQSGTLVNGFTYAGTAAPTVTSLSIGTGGTVGGTSVTITGTGFLSGATVLFGLSPATSVVVATSTSISCVTPAHLGAATVNVTVINTDAQSGVLTNGFIYTLSSAPTLSSLSVTQGPAWGGTLVTITGTGFASGATVTVGGANATSVSVASSTSITMYTPAAPGGVTGVAKDVVVVNPDAQSATLSNSFTYGAQNIFVTSATYNGDLGGLIGGDFRCQIAAANAGLSGTWRAILSSSTVNASSHITYSSIYTLNFRPSASGGPQAVPNAAHGIWGSTAYAFNSPVGYDENGVALNGTVWTNTNNDGTRASTASHNTCSDWGSRNSSRDAHTGSSAATTNVFNTGSSDSCNTLQHLFCIDGQSAGPTPSNPTSFVNTATGIDQATFTFVGSTNTAGFRMAYTTGATAPANCQSGTQISAYTIALSTHYTVTGLNPGTQYSFRLCATNSDQSAFSSGLTTTITTPTQIQQVFVSESTVNGAIGGVYFADMICQSDALNAGLSGTWKAIISGTGFDASSRIAFTHPLYDMHSSPAMISRDSVDFWAGIYSVGIEYGPDEAHLGAVDVWVGSASSGTVSSNTCGNWGFLFGAAKGEVGISNATSSVLIDNGYDNCTTLNHLYCLNMQTSSSAPPDPATFVNTATGTDQATFTFTSGGGTPPDLDWLIPLVRPPLRIVFREIRSVPIPLGY